MPFSLALKAPSFALKAPGLPFSLALKDLDLPSIPGSQALESAGPVLLSQPPQRPQHDGADDHPFMEPAASQHMTHHAQPDQPQRRLTGKARVPRLRHRPAAARRDDGQRRPPAPLPRSCHAASRPEAPAHTASVPRDEASRHHPRGGDLVPGRTRFTPAWSSRQAPIPREWVPGLGGRSHREAAPAGRPGTAAAIS